MTSHNSFLLINCEVGKKPEVKDKLESFDEVKEVIPTNGIYDLIVKVESKSEQSKDLRAQIREMKNIQSTLALAVVDQNNPGEISL